MAEVLRQGSLLLIGLFSGAMVAGGMYAFAMIIGVVTRMVARTKTSRYAYYYEVMVLLGAGAANAIYVLEVSLPMSEASELLCKGFFGFFSGVYVGCIALALAEILKVLPIMARRLRLSFGLSAFVLSFALGKFVGAIFDFFV